MRRILISAILIALPLVGLANPKGSVINQVQYQLSAEKWATTKTAKVIVNVNATLNEKGLSNINQDITDSLKKIVPDVAWHIVAFNRSKTESGLETVNATAQARVPNNKLADLRGKAKAVSKPGTTYQIANIEFTPSQADLQRTRAQLRNKIYQEVKQELNRLNTVYPNEHFQVNSINFTSQPLPIRQRGVNREMLTAAVASPAPQMSVSAKVVQNALVVFAAPFQNNSKASKTTNAK